MSLKLPNGILLWLDASSKPMLPSALLPYLEHAWLAGPAWKSHHRALQHQYPTLKWHETGDPNPDPEQQTELWWYQPHQQDYHWNPTVFYHLATGIGVPITMAVRQDQEEEQVALDPFNRILPVATPMNSWQMLGLGLIRPNPPHTWAAFTSSDLAKDLSLAIPRAGLPVRPTHPSDPGKRAVFIDRDGVLNRRLPGDYVKTLKEFEWLPNTWKAVRRLSNRFDYVFIVTNQQGVGKGIMSGADLEVIHLQMLDELKQSKARVDGIYACPGLKSEHPPCRKPNTGMAWQAKTEFPDIDWSQSWMAGDALSDLEFGLRLGMQVAAIMEQAPAPAAVLANRVCSDLYAFAKSFKS
ncbi:MAG: HAD family hydrolase [Saprospiraceae bacterium]|nr:HAD family hydrolase [Saprospiraceae bacterium]